MAHELTLRADKTYEFAFTGEPAWHGLGQELEKGASIETWKKQAGLDWEVFQSHISYQSSQGQHTFPDRLALFRSDTNEGLSIVSKDYHVVQPGEVLEFFRDVTTFNGFQLSAAGSLFGGKRFWATADVGKEFQAVSGDKIHGQLLLITSVDGTLSTQAKFTSTRTVCQNTLNIALSEKGNSVRKTHSSAWNPEEFKIDLGLIDSGWATFTDNIKKLTEKKVTDDFAKKYFMESFYDPEKLAQDQGIGAIKKVNTLMELYRTGAGSGFSYGTAYGLLNAGTELFTHGISKNRDSSHQFWNSSFGKDSKEKSKIYSELLALCA